MTKTKNSTSLIKSNMGKLFTLSAAHFTNDFFATMIQPISFVFAAALGLTLGQQGIISVIGIIFGSLMQPLFGMIVDKKETAKYLPFSVLWISIIMSLTGLAPNFTLLMICVSLGSIASAFFHPAGSINTINLMKQGRGKALSTFMTVGGFAGSISTIVMIPLASEFGKESTIYLIPFGIIISVILWISWKDTIQEHTALEKKNKDIVSEKIRLFDGLTSKDCLFALLLILVGSIMYSSFAIFISYGVQLLEIKNISLALASLCITLHLFLRPFGTMFGGYLADKKGDRFAFIISLSFCLFFMSMVAIASGFWAVIGFVVSGFFAAIRNTPTVTIMQDIFPKNRGFATGLILGLPKAFGSVLLIGYGFLSDLAGLENAIKITPILLLLCILPILFIPKK